MAGNKKKKKGFSLIILLLVMVVLVGACFWATEFKKDKTAADSTESSEDETNVVSIDKDTLTSIYFKNASGEMTLVKGSDGKWQSAEDEALPVNQTNAEGMASALSSVTSSSTLKESAEELSTYGLDDPAIQVIATVKDGTKTTIKVGKETPLNDGYYATVEGKEGIFVIPDSFYTDFNYKPTEMVTVETIPAVTADNVTYLKVENKDKKSFEAVYDESKASDYSGLNFWTIKQPYATELAGNADNLKTLFGNYASLAFASCVDYNAKDLSKYGLDNPASSITLKYFEVYTKSANSSDTADSSDASNTSEADTTKVYKEIDLLVGSQDADGNYYVKLKDSTAVNTMSADTVDKIINIDAYSNVSHNVSLVNIKSVSSVDIATGGKTYTLKIDQAADTSDSTQTSGDEASAQYYFNGKKADESKFKTLYQGIIGISTEKDIPEAYFKNTVNKTPVMTVTFHMTTGKNMTVSYLPYDESYNVVDADGVEYFLTDLRGINKLADSLASFKTE